MIANKIVVSAENIKAMEFINKIKARKQEIKAHLSKGVILAKDLKK